MPAFGESVLENVIRNGSVCGDNGAAFDACKRCGRKRLGVVVEINDHHLIAPEPSFDAVAMYIQRQVEHVSVVHESDNGRRPGKPLEGGKRLDCIALPVNEVDDGGFRLSQYGCDRIGYPIGFHRQDGRIDGSGKAVRHDGVDMG